jgi:hypothetical protein
MPWNLSLLAEVAAGPLEVEGAEDEVEEEEEVEEAEEVEEELPLEPLALALSAELLAPERLPLAGPRDQG